MQLTLPKRDSKYAPAELGEAHREIIRLYAMGAGVQEIATEMGCSRSHVRYVVNSPLAMEMRRELQERKDEKCADVMGRLAEMCPNAVKLMQDVMDGEMEASIPLRIKVCESILDRAGYGKIARTQNFNVSTALTAEDILDLRKRAAAEAREVGVLA